MRPDSSRGRLHPEPESATRSPWQRDRDRIIHSSAFRKLQYKTQVFVNHEGDFYRTRLTHSLEVAQIARSVARELALDEDLTEALALAHDLGHPPFGHAGEEALAAAMKPFGGFDHNAQSLRVVTLLESRYAAFDGLNLTWETLEGLAKHNGPLQEAAAATSRTTTRRIRLELSTHASAEAQVAALADDIAYHSHDLDDGWRASLFQPSDLSHLPVVGRGAGRGRACQPRRAAAAPAPRDDPARHQRAGHAIWWPKPARRIAALAPQDVRRDPPRQAAGRGVQPGHGRGEPRDQGVPVRAHVSALACQPHDRQGAPADRRRCSRCCTPTRRCCRTTGGAAPGSRAPRARRPRSPTTWPA